MAAPRRQSGGFTSPQSNSDTERLRQEVERIVARLRLEFQQAIDAIDTGGGSGAPTDATYVTISNNGTLTNERRLAAGTGITITDGGANNTVTIASTGGTSQEQVEDWVAGLIDDTSSITWSYNDAGGSLTASIVTEAVQDIVGAMVTGGTGITATYNDAGGTLSIASTVTQYTDEMAQDAVGAAFLDTTSVLATYNDGANTMSWVAVWPQTIYEVDFASLANNTLTNGTEVIDGLSWTAANMGSLGTADILNGTGLRMNAGTSLGNAQTFTTGVGARTAPNLQIPLSSIPNWDGRYDIIIEVYVTWLLEGNGESLFVGLYSASAAPSPSSLERCRLARISQNSGVRNLSTITAATLTNSNVATTAQVLSTRILARGAGMAGLGTTYSGGWPTLDNFMQFADETGVISPYNWSGVNLVLGVGVINDATPTTAVTFRRMRVMRC